MALLKVLKREAKGSRKAHKLRAGGEVPGILYGHGEQTVAITLNQHDITEAIRHGERLMELVLDGKNQNVLVKEVQYDTLGKELLHIDLARVDLDERVRVTVPIVLRGTPAGIANEGVLMQNADEVTIEVAVRLIPDEIRVMVTHLNVNDVIHMRELTLPEGAKLLSDPDAMVCSVNVITEEVAPAEVAEAAAEPEVLTERKEKEPQEESKE